MPSDIGVFVGRYLQAVGLLSIASMILALIFFRSGYLDFSFIFYFWGGRHLVKHNPTARKWVIGTAAFLTWASPTAPRG